MNTNKYIGLLLSAIGIFGLVACGGGGGGEYKPLPFGLIYTGVTSPAIIDSNNAVELASGAFIGGETGSDFGIISSVTADQSKILREIKLYQVAQIFSEPLYKIDINSHRKDSLAVQTEQDTIQGDCGGSASYTVNVDDVTGVFTGSMTFNDYCSENTTISGTAGFSGQVEINTGDFLNFNLDIKMVNIASENQTYIIDGDISVDVSGTLSTALLEMLMQDNSGEVFWVNNYVVIISEDVDYVDIEASGRFYNPTYGYVDLFTNTPLRTYNNNDWPSSGEMQIVGGEGTKARLLVGNENFYQVIADTNGDEKYNYYSGQVSWNGGSWKDALVPEGVVILPKFTIASEVTPSTSDTFRPGKTGLGFDGTNYLVVSCREIGSPIGIFGATVSGEREILNTFHIADINPVFGCQGQRPSVAFDGTNYLIAFSRVTETGSSDIVGVRVTPAGSVLDGPDGFRILSDVSNVAVIAFDGTNYLVVSVKYNNSTFHDIFGARVNTVGQVLDEFPIFIAPGAQNSPSVAFDGVNYLVIWSDTRSGGSFLSPDEDIFGTRVNPAGIVLDPEGFPISTAQGTQESPCVIFDGTNYFAVWEDTRNDPNAYPPRLDIFGARIKPDGTILDGTSDTGGIAINTASFPKQYPVVSFDGTNNFVTWEVSSSYNPPIGIFAARVSTAGLLIDGPSNSEGIPISKPTCFPCHLYNPNIIFNGEELLITWVNNEEYGPAKDIEGGLIFLY